MFKTPLNKVMLLWRFSDAPKELQALSDHGGDEDWLLFVPDGVEGPYWIVDSDENNYFGCCSISHRKIKGGTVHIGAHS